MIKSLFFLFLIILIAPEIPAQSLSTYLGDEEILYAQTKQVNQFFRRFNCEESTEGIRYYPGDSLYHDNILREKYLNISFDLENQLLTDELKQSFLTDILKDETPVYLDFHGGEWVAEANSVFIYKGEEHRLSLFLQLQEEEVGSKWVITNIYFEPFSSLFSTGEPDEMKFLHPLSHELDFMNLIHIFRDSESIEQYAEKGYEPDYLTLFIYEIKKGNLTFKTVSTIKFHFFQISGWYFELSDFNRKSKNSGWLISKLASITPEEKELIMKYIYHD